MEYGASDISSTISKVANVALTTIVHPIGFVTNVEKAYKQTEKESVAQLVVGGASNALLAVAPFTGAIKTAVVKAVTSTIAKAPIKSLAVGLIGGGALISSPTLVKTAVKTIAATPETLVGTGEKIGNVIERTSSLSDLTSKDVKNIAVAAGAGAVVAAGAAVAYDYLQDKKEEKAQLLPETPANANESGISVTDKSGEMYKVMPMPETTPTTPVTHEVKAGTSTKKKKRTSKALPQNISQRVNVVVSNRSSSVGIKQNKKYINERILN